MEKKMENEMETGILLGVIYWGNIGIMEKKMETTIVYCGYIRVEGYYPPIMENQMEKNMEHGMETGGI